MRYFIHLNYNGSGFHGWQIQPNGTSIQEALEETLSLMLGEATRITGCGRTDTGVHARQYFAHFDTEAVLPEKAVLRLNKMLPPSIGVREIFEVPAGTHARFDAVRREYRYFIHFGKDAFLQDRSYWIYGYEFDLDLMNEAAAVLLNYNDFTTFEKAHGGNKTSLCEVYKAEWTAIDENQWCFTIAADRFLRNMVRRITGALLSIGNGQMSIEEMTRALAELAPLHVNFAPPAHGLFLWQVDYPKEKLIERAKTA